MKYLIYMSTSVRLFADAELRELLRESQAYNAVHDISGMLLYSQGSFTQVLEGENEDVATLYDRIKKDQRHKNIILLAEGPLSKRLFPEWSMGFKSVSTEDFSKFDAYVNPKEHQIWEKAGLHPATRIMRIFAETNNF